MADQEEKQSQQQESQEQQDPQDQQPDSTSCCNVRPDWLGEPGQAELSEHLSGLKDHLRSEGGKTSILMLGDDGVMRSFGRDRTVRWAAGLTPDQIRLWHRRQPGKWSDPAFRWPEGGTKIPDGTKVPREEWYNPDPSLLPARPSAERMEESRRATEAGPEARRAYLEKLKQIEIDAGRWWHD